MVDFAKLMEKSEEEKLDYLYECSKCLHREWYWVFLPAHMLVHEDYFAAGNGVARRCRGGKLVHVATRRHHR